MTGQDEDSGRREKFFKKTFILQYEVPEAGVGEGSTETIIVNPNPKGAVFAIRIMHLNGIDTAYINLIMRNHDNALLENIRTAAASGGRNAGPEGELRSDDWMSDGLEKGTFSAPPDMRNYFEPLMGMFASDDYEALAEMKKRFDLMNARKLLTGDEELDRKITGAAIKIAQNKDIYSELQLLASDLEGWKEKQPDTSPVPQEDKKSGWRWFR